MAAITSPFETQHDSRLMSAWCKQNKMLPRPVNKQTSKQNKAKVLISRPSLATSPSSNQGGAHNPHLLCHVPRPSRPHPQCLAWPALNLYLVEHPQTVLNHTESERILQGTNSVNLRKDSRKTTDFFTKCWTTPRGPPRATKISRIGLLGSWANMGREVPKEPT